MTAMTETLHRWAGWRVNIGAKGAALEAELTRPAGAKGLVLSAAANPEEQRATWEADYLHTRGLATLRFGYQDEEIEHLSRLFYRAARWAEEGSETRDLPIGFLGTGMAAAAMITTAASLGPGVKAVVARSGRVDLAEPILPRVFSPTLLILGSLDPEGIILNRAAYRRIPTAKAFCVVPGATSRFEEDFTQHEAGELAAAWFLEYLLARD